MKIDDILKQSKIIFGINYDGRQNKWANRWKLRVIGLVYGPKMLTNTYILEVTTFSAKKTPKFPAWLISLAKKIKFYSLNHNSVVCGA